MSGWWELINPMRDRFITGEVENGPHSLSALIPTLFMDTVNTVPYKRNIMNLDEANVKLLLNLSRLFFVGLTLYFLRWVPFKRNDDSISRYWELSYILIITPLIFPQQLCYSFLYILPSIAYILWYILASRKNVKGSRWNTPSIIILFLLFVSFVMLTLTSEDFIGRRNTEITYHFRIITFGTFTLIAILGLCIPPQRKYS